MQETPSNRAITLKVVADLKVGTTTMVADLEVGTATDDPFDEVDI